MNPSKLGQGEKHGCTAIGKDATGQKSSSKTTAVEDSLMEFIADYFQGDVTNNFSISEYFNPSDESTPSSATSNSIELVTSPENSLNSSGNSNNDSSCPADLTKIEQPRRKSISYEIRFTNSKEENGKVRIQIVPAVRNDEVTAKPAFNLSIPIPPPNGNENQKLQHENNWLRQKLHELERKLHCMEKESERVVSQLTRIIERKNDTISQLELQIAGIKFMSSGN